jgi:hypothetical protein
MTADYPAEAYAPSGEPWWLLKTAPGTKRTFGAEQKIAAWLFFNKDIGSTFTLRELRSALPVGDIPNDQEHFNRRMRALRKDEWVLQSQKDDGTLRTNEYRVVAKGWSPHLGDRKKGAGNVSSATRRRVFASDGNRCVVCGVGSGEPYPDPPVGKAVLTIGHRIPQNMGGTDDIDNLRTECKRCNEQARDETGLPETLREVNAEVRSLTKNEKKALLQWLSAGQRVRNRVDVLYDRARMLSPSDREDLIKNLRASVGPASS